jgi:hypothetical protein
MDQEMLFLFLEFCLLLDDRGELSPFKKKPFGTKFPSLADESKLKKFLYIFKIHHDEQQMKLTISEDVWRQLSILGSQKFVEAEMIEDHIKGVQFYKKDRHLMGELKDRSLRWVEAFPGEALKAVKQHTAYFTNHFRERAARKDWARSITGWMQRNHNPEYYQRRYNPELRKEKIYNPEEAISKMVKMKKI